MTIYVDDTAVPFTSRNQLVKGMSIIYSILAQLGLEMHVGKQIDGEWGASKTECIFFPEGAFFKHQAVEMELPARDVLALSEGAEEESDAAREKKESLEEMLYNQCDETAPVSVGDGRITFCCQFKYLGDSLAFNGRDDHAIDMRIAAASRAMGALKGFFSRREICIHSKRLIFEAIIINLLLWGCESWALRKDHILKLERFMNRQIRRILKINMWQVKDEHITVEQLRGQFDNIISVRTMIDVRRARFIGKIVRDDVDSPHREMLIAFVHNTRNVGRPLLSTKESILHSLQRLLEPIQGIHVNHLGSLNEWYFSALDPGFWKLAIAHLRDPSKPVPEKPNRDASFHPRRSRRQRGGRSDSSTSSTGASRENSPPRADPRGEDSRPSVSPPRRNAGNTGRDDEQRRDYDPDNVGRVMYDSLKVFGLGYSASYAEVKALYRTYARTYHPDQHRSERTGMTDEAAMRFFQLVNNAHNYLKDKLN